MDVLLNITMNYTHMFLHYCGFEGMDVINMPFHWMNMMKSFLDNPPCFNINRDGSHFFYLNILLLKNFIISQGMMQILPKWVSLTCFPVLLAYYHYFLITGEEIECVFTTLKFGFIWSMLWLCAPNVTTKLGFYISGLSIVELVLEFYDYVAYQLAIDMFIVLISMWYMVRSFVNRRFSLIVPILVGYVFYSSNSNDSEIPLVLYIFLHITLPMFMKLFRLYVTSNGNDEDLMIFMSVVSGIAIIMLHMENFLIESIAGNSAMKVDKSAISEILKPEVESVIFTPNANGTPDFSAEMLVKYRENETAPTMLF